MPDWDHEEAMEARKIRRMIAAQDAVDSRVESAGGFGWPRYKGSMMLKFARDIFNIPVAAGFILLSLWVIAMDVLKDSLFGREEEEEG